MLALSFLTPEAALVGLAAVLPLLALAAGARRSARAAQAVGLEPRPGRTLLAGGTVAALGVLVAIGAAQPVTESETARYVREDAEAFFVIDTSRSMLAAAAPGEPRRIERARAIAREIREQLGEVPAGVASFTDRTLPHLFPTTAEDAFSATVDHAVGIDNPPPIEGTGLLSTSFAALTAIPQRRFFSPDAEKRLVVVVSDGETRGFELDGAARTFQDERYGIVYVHVWDGSERVWSGAGAEPYAADPAATTIADRFIAAAGGRRFDEGEVDAAAAAAREFLGDGPKVAQGTDRHPVSLTPWVLAAGIFPLGLLLWRRPL